MRKLELGHGMARWWALCALLLAACFSALDPSGLGGESHFLSRCKDSCGMGLDCIQGVCTRGCLVGKQSCRDLSDDAVCTSASVEPGEVAVCDVACAGDRDCSGISTRHRCEAGFCRAAAAASVPGSDAGGASTSDGGVSGGNSDFPYPADRVFPCPKDAPRDPVDLSRSLIAGNQLHLRIAYGGGCAKHELAVCYDPEFLDTVPLYAALQVIHDGHGDSCEAYLTEDRTFDLTPLGDVYLAARQTSMGRIATDYGMYTFGRLECDDRTTEAANQQRIFEREASQECSMAADCTRAPTNTRCTTGCFAVVSNTGASEITSWLGAMDEGICGDYAGDGCPALPEPRCATTKTLACVDGKCKEQ